MVTCLLISSCGLRLDDEAIRVSVGIRLGAKLCEVHVCPCGTQVDVRGTHGLSCKRSSGRIGRHHSLNDILCRALARADFHPTKEPLGIVRSDGRRPDGVTQISWMHGKSLTWDVTVTDTLANSYIHLTSASAGAAAELAAEKKTEKYADLATNYLFTPVAFETLGPMNEEGSEFIHNIGQRLTSVTGDKREPAFLRKRLSIALQRYNAICFRGTFESHFSLNEDCT